MWELRGQVASSAGLGEVGLGQLRAIRQVVADSDAYWLLGAEQAGPHISLVVHALKIVFDNNPKVSSMALMMELDRHFPVFISIAHSLFQF